MSANEYVQLLRLLTGAGVEFVVVGGTAAVLHGASMATYDLDVLMPFTPDDCARLLQGVAAVRLLACLSSQRLQSLGPARRSLGETLQQHLDGLDLRGASSAVDVIRSGRLAALVALWCRLYMSSSHSRSGRRGSPR